MTGALGRILAWTLLIGGISFSAGFFGPILLTPDANQGPLLGIFITGPLGTLAGFAIGVVRELMGRRTGPLQLLESMGVDWRTVRRVLAAVVGIILLVHGLRALPEGAGRPAASAFVVGAALLWYASGRSPDWFRR